MFKIVSCLVVKLFIIPSLLFVFYLFICRTWLSSLLVFLNIMKTSSLRPSGTTFDLREEKKQGKLAYYRAHDTNLKMEGRHCCVLILHILSQPEEPENFWNFDSSRLAKSSLLDFYFK